MSIAMGEPREKVRASFVEVSGFWGCFFRGFFYEEAGGSGEGPQGVGEIKIWERNSC